MTKLEILYEEDKKNCYIFTTLGEKEPKTRIGTNKSIIIYLYTMKTENCFIG